MEENESDPNDKQKVSETSKNEQMAIITGNNNKMMMVGQQRDVELHQKLKRFRWAGRLFEQCKASEDNENTGPEHILDEHIQRLSKLRNWRQRNNNKSSASSSTSRRIDPGKKKSTNHSDDDEDEQENGQLFSVRPVESIGNTATNKRRGHNVPHILHVVNIQIIKDIEKINEADHCRNRQTLNIPNWISRPIQLSDIKMILLNAPNYSHLVTQPATKYFLKTKQGSYVQIPNDDYHLDQMNPEEYSFRIIA